jgi:hypothetical protein
LELLLKEADLGKADASAEKAEAAPINELLKPVPKREAKKERRERWPQDLPVEREIIEPVLQLSQKHRHFFRSIASAYLDDNASRLEMKKEPSRFFLQTKPLRL